jgi:hypothetical protein
VELDEALAARPLDSGVPVTAFAGHSMSDRTERARLLAGKLLNKVVHAFVAPTVPRRSRPRSRNGSARHSGSTPTTRG